MVSVARGSAEYRARPDRHIQRQEKAAWITLAQAKLAKDLRAERSGQLIFFCNLLRGYTPDKSEPLSVAQVSRLTTQAWAVLRFYETFDLWEQRGEVHAQPIKTAAVAVGSYFGLNSETVRGWLLDYEQSMVHLRLMAEARLRGNC